MKKTVKFVKFMKKTVKIQKKKNRAIHATNVKFMKIHGKKSEIQEKSDSWKKGGIHGKKTWNSRKTTWNSCKETYNSWNTTWTGFVQAKKKRCDASVISSSTLIPFYLRLLTIYVSPYLHKTAPHHMNRTELTPEPITVSSHPSIPLFPPPLPSSFPFLAGLVCRTSLPDASKANWK